MWRRTYLLLALIRLWFALSPSYLHPDENFQGPEVIAGMSAAQFPGHFVERISPFPPPMCQTCRFPSPFRYNL